MSQSTLPDPPLSAVPLSFKSKTIGVCRWLLVRVGAAVVTGFLVAFGTAFISDDRTKTWLLENRYLASGGWLLNRQLNIRWERVWMTGMLLGACLPNVRLSEWLKRVLLGGLIGMPVTLFGLGLMDGIMASDAVDCAYGPFANIPLPNTHPDSGFVRPGPDSMMYPSVYRELFTCTLIGGLGCGLIAGCAWASAGIKRKVFVMVAATATIALGVQTCWQASASFDEYAQRQQKSIREQLDKAILKTVTPKVNDDR